VEPIDGGEKSKVTIATEVKSQMGIGGWLERQTAPLIMRRIYHEELAQLNRWLREGADRG
jgi:hypothetical protein